jgi:hypothetical protein
MEKLDRELKGREFKRKVIDLLKADDFAGVVERHWLGCAGDHG